MPDRRLHRGPHPEDARLFAPDRWPGLQAATSDLGWLLSHDYALNSALKLVGDRYALTERQRIAVMRSSCSDQSLALRRANQATPVQLRGQPLHLDGYNVLTTLESALAGPPHSAILRGRDGCLRDMASMHGHYKRVLETGPALVLLGDTLASLGVAAVQFYLDSPVSNSGRLKKMILQTADQHGWPWTVDLVTDPDPILACSPHIIATADSVILDGTRNHAGQPSPRWFNLTAYLIAAHIPKACVVPMA